MLLSDIMRSDIFVGTSLILRRGGRFLYGIRPAKPEKARTILELTGIGGALEKEDASLTAGALREAQEEIGCAARVLPCAETLVVRGEGEIERVQIEGPERPAAVVFRRFRTPAHHPWHAENRGAACIAVFAADLEGEPAPSHELPCLIWLTPAQILQTARADVRLRELIEPSAGFMCLASPPEETSWARLTDSQEALALALGARTTSFYNSFGAE